MPAVRGDSGQRRHLVAILLVSLAGLLLEVGYTRIVSYKLWYYYTYLVIGLSLLGIGSGGVFVAVCKPAAQMAHRSHHRRVLARRARSRSPSATSRIARIRSTPSPIWDYGSRASFRNLAALGLICFMLFAAFIALGVIISVLLGRAGDGVGRLYFADLVGAGLGCLFAIPLITRLGPPRVIAFAALVFAVVGSHGAAVEVDCSSDVGALLAIGLAVVVVSSTALPDVRVEDAKVDASGALYSEWGPVFRVDVVQFFEDQPNRLLAHDGTFGSGIWQFDGDPASLDALRDRPARDPVRVLGTPPERELIIGSAGGQEILTSLYFGAPHIEAVELNPVTVSLLTDHFADFTGHLADRPDVDLHEGDGRSYLARSDGSYDLVWYVAPDSYAATNAASSGAFVLSESYLYTTEMIEETLRAPRRRRHHGRPVRRARLPQHPEPHRRYVVTAREALEQLGIEDPSQHLLVAAHLTAERGRPVDDHREAHAVHRRRGRGLHRPRRAVPAGRSGVRAGGAATAFADHPVSRLAGGERRARSTRPSPSTHGRSSARHRTTRRSSGTSRRSATCSRHIFDPLDVFNPEDVIGERVLLLLLGDRHRVRRDLPAVAVRRSCGRQWSALPAKGISAVYFAALGLGFMFFEITMIQRLDALPRLSDVLAHRDARVDPRVHRARRAAEPALRRARRPDHADPARRPRRRSRVFYQFGLDPLTDSLLSTSLARARDRRRSSSSPRSACASACSCRSASRASRSLTDQSRASTSRGRGR